MDIRTSVRRWLPSLFLCSLSVSAFPQAGSLDPSVDPGVGASGTVRLVGVQPDGKIVLGGTFTMFNNTPAGNIVRLLPNGTVDNTFLSGSGFNGVLLDLEVQADGKLLVYQKNETVNAFGEALIPDPWEPHLEGNVLWPGLDMLPPECRSWYQAEMMPLI